MGRPEGVRAENKHVIVMHKRGRCFAWVGSKRSCSKPGSRATHRYAIESFELRAVKKARTGNLVLKWGKPKTVAFVVIDYRKMIIAEESQLGDMR